ncbi:hypothetical protein Dimus_036750, partial [Dionaea muscipula]
RWQMATTSMPGSMQQPSSHESMRRSGMHKACGQHACGQPKAKIMGRKQAMEEQLQQAVDARASPALPTGSNIIIHVAKKSHAAKKPMRPGSIIIRPRRPSRGRASSCSQQLNVRPTPRTAMLDGDQAHVGTYARPWHCPSGDLVLPRLSLTAASIRWSSSSCFAA